MRQRIFKLVPCLLLVAMLAGCFQVQVSGTVVGSVITISRIDGVGGTIVIGSTEGGEPWIAAQGLSYWQSLPALWQIWLSGIVQIPGDITIDPNVYYLATASGGVDNDPLRTRDLSGGDADVTGDLHAIVKGDRLLQGNLIISILTESIYQALKTRLSRMTKKELAAELDALTRPLITDVDDNDRVNYLDALAWSYLLHEDNYKGDSTRLGMFADQYTAEVFNQQRANSVGQALREKKDPAGAQNVTVCAGVVHKPPPGKPEFPSRIEIDTDFANAPGPFTMTIFGANDNQPVTIDVARETGIFGIKSYGDYKIGDVTVGSSDVTSSFAVLPVIPVREKDQTFWCKDIQVTP